MRERLLTQHFLQRFVENDLLSPDADRHQAIALVGGGLLALGLFLSIGISTKFLFMMFPSPGRTALLAVGDRLVFVALAMIVMSLVAVLTWDALSLDPCCDCRAAAAGCRPKRATRAADGLRCAGGGGDAARPRVSGDRRSGEERSTGGLRDQELSGFQIDRRSGVRTQEDVLDRRGALRRVATGFAKSLCVPTMSCDSCSQARSSSSRSAADAMQT